MIEMPTRFSKIIQGYKGKEKEKKKFCPGNGLGSVCANVQYEKGHHCSSTCIGSMNSVVYNEE